MTKITQDLKTIQIGDRNNKEDSGWKEDGTEKPNNAARDLKGNTSKKDGIKHKTVYQDLKIENLNQICKEYETS